MVYRLLRVLIRHALRVFFRRIELEGIAQVPPEGPLVLGANHPNTLIDVLLVASSLERKVGFVAKATLFAHPLANALLRFFGAVPILRPQDGGGGELDPEARARNQNALAACEEHVAEGGAILIFPEGVSQDEPRLMTLKTGLARIALGAEARTPGRVQVVPVSLIYDDPSTFRSRARVRFGPPLHAAPFRAQGEAAGDPFVGVRALTEAVRAAMIADVVHVEAKELDPVLRELDELYGETVSDRAGGRLAATAAIAQAMNDFAQREPERVAALRATLDGYREALASAGVDDAAVRDQRQPSLGADLAFLVGAPLAAWGALNHLVLYNIPRLVLSLLPTTDKLYFSTVKLLTGLLGLAACYALQGYGVWWLSRAHTEWFASAWTPTLAYLGTLPLCGLIALLWVEGLESRWRARRARATRRRLGRQQLTALQSRRAHLLEQLDAAQADWLARAEAGDSQQTDEPF